MSEAVDSPINVLKLLPDLLFKIEIVLPSRWSWRPRRCDVTSVLSQSCVASAAPSSYIRAAICFEGETGFLSDWWRLGGAVLPSRPLPSSVTDPRPPAAQGVCKSDLDVHLVSVKTSALHIRVENKQTSNQRHTHTSSKPCTGIETECGLQ